MLLNRIRVNLTFLFAIAGLILLVSRQYAVAVGVVVGGILTLGLLGHRMVLAIPGFRARRERQAIPPTPLKTALLFALVSMYLPILGLVLILLGPKIGGPATEAMGAVLLSGWVAIPFLLYAAAVQASSLVSDDSSEGELFTATGLKCLEGQLLWRQPNGNLRTFDVDRGAAAAGSTEPRVGAIVLAGYDVKAVAGGRVGSYLILILDEQGDCLGRIVLPGSQLGISVLKGFHPTISESARSDLVELCDTLGLKYSEETFDDAQRLARVHPGSARMAWYLSNPGLGVVVGAALTVAVLLLIIGVTTALSHT